MGNLIRNYKHLWNIYTRQERERYQHLKSPIWSSPSPSILTISKATTNMIIVIVISILALLLSHLCI